MLKDSFCSSPWYHARITYNGDFEKCRWINQQEHKYNLRDISLIAYHNSDEMSQFRVDMLNGCSPKGCSECYYQDQHNKLSGRHRQLLKSAINPKDFTNSLLSSPHLEDFKYSNITNGHTEHELTDLQIDLGNLCNSACIMCDPMASSKLTQDYIKLHKKSDLFKEPKLYKSWTADPELANKLVQDLKSLKNLKYVHLLGGETLFNESFYDICDALSENCIVGTTTNGTIYTDRLAKIIPKFKEFHLGISIETVTTLNNYIRYPSDINLVLDNINKFLKLRSEYPGLFISLRITPNIFTAYELDKLFEFTIENDITVESCNILSDPESLRMELMPDDIREEIIVKLQFLVDKYDLKRHNIVNVRKSSAIKQVTADSVHEYLDFIKNYVTPMDVAEQRKHLVEFLKSFESIRNNSILDYAPRYREFLTSIGY